MQDLMFRTTENSAFYSKHATNFFGLKIKAKSLPIVWKVRPNIYKTRSHVCVTVYAISINTVVNKQLYISFFYRLYYNAYSNAKQISQTNSIKYIRISLTTFKIFSECSLKRHSMYKALRACLLYKYCLP